MPERKSDIILSVPFLNSGRKKNPKINSSVILHFYNAFWLQIASYVNKSAMDTAVLQRSLAILESMVLNSQDLYQKVAQEITIGQLIPHLQG